MSRLVQRWVSTAILLGWLVPGALAAGIGLHLSLDDHGRHAHHHEGDLAELLQAATHGHHHEFEWMADHEHDARLDGRAAVDRPVLVAATGRVQPSPAPPVPTPQSGSNGLPLRAPPTALCQVHCVLLI